MNCTPVSILTVLVIGAASAGYLQHETGWWLDAGDRVPATLLVLLVQAIVVGLWGDGCLRLRAASLWSGFMVGLTATLILRGAGTIWPIVLAVSGLLTGATIVLGIGLASGLARVTRLLRSPISPLTSRDAAARRAQSLPSRSRSSMTRSDGTLVKH